MRVLYGTMPIYTKTGDGGKTSLANGSRTEKSSDRIEFVGAIDELNSCIGFLLVELKNPNAPDDQTAFIESLQSFLFVTGSLIANPEPENTSDDLFDQSTAALEQNIDALEKTLIPLRNFILPGGSEKAARSHLCRTTTRRVERMFFRMQPTLALPPALGRFLNRLSDYFFVLARYCNHVKNVPDIIWKQK